MRATGDRTNATPPQMLRHVLRPDELVTRTHYGSASPAAALLPWVERYWSVQWQFGAEESYSPATLDDPSVNVTFERGGVARASTTGAGDWITGPITQGHFDVTLSGAGSVVGVKFQVGGTAAFTTADLTTLRDVTIPAAEWFGERVPTGLAPSADVAAPELDAWLLSLRPCPPPGYDRFRTAYVALADPAVTTLAALAERTELSERTLQREFRRFAGVAPKRLLVRARVIDALGALNRDPRTSLGELAASLGWFDQSHFIRDFRSVIGETPTSYVRSHAQGTA